MIGATLRRNLRRIGVRMQSQVFTDYISNQKLHKFEKNVDFHGNCDFSATRIICMESGRTLTISPGTKLDGASIEGFDNVEFLKNDSINKDFTFKYIEGEFLLRGQISGVFVIYKGIVKYIKSNLVNSCYLLGNTKLINSILNLNIDLPRRTNKSIFRSAVNDYPTLYVERGVQFSEAKLTNWPLILFTSNHHGKTFLMKVKQELARS